MTKLQPTITRNYQHMHKLNQMKLKPGLKVYSAIQPTLAYVMAAVNYEL